MSMPASHDDDVTAALLERVLVDAHPAREHLARLSIERGLSAEQVAELAGLDAADIRLIKSDSRRQIEPETERAILTIPLAVRVGRVDGTEARRLVDELLAAGWKRGQIALAIGNAQPKLSLKRQMMPRTHRAIVELHARVVAKGLVNLCALRGSSRLSTALTAPLVALEQQINELNAVPWRRRAACRDIDPNVFFPTPGENTEVARAVCATCPVRGQCLDHALARREKDGIWGGLDEHERRALLRLRSVS